jgi:hypothetical protein
MRENNLTDWINSDTPLTRTMFEEYRILCQDEPTSIQVLFFKKLVNQIARGNKSLNISDLLAFSSRPTSIQNQDESSHTREFDYTFDVIVHTLNLINQRQRFPRDPKEVNSLVRDISDFICDYLQNRVDSLRKIDLLFDKCPGRTSIVTKKPEDKFVHLRGNNYKVYPIYQGYSIFNRDKSGWGNLVVHYHSGIYAKGKVCLLEVKSRKTDSKGNEQIVYGNNISFNGKLFPFQWEQNNDKFLITPDVAPVESCEGRESPVVCNLSGKKFWWCYGRKCFKANQVDHLVDEWRNYTLRDILKILGLPFDDVGYYMFVSEVNRLNRLLSRIKCEDCQSILRPAKQTHFGFYRVSSFRCNNENHNNEKCPSFHKEVYLTHCLNSRCTNIIDDRVAKRCPNGFIICDKCGSCCSNEQFARRIEGLQSNGQSVPVNLSKWVAEKAGHWENGVCYCFKCQKEMKEDRNGDFKCTNCDTRYDRYDLYLRFFKGSKSKQAKWVDRDEDG